MNRKNRWASRSLAEVEVFDEIAEKRNVFAHRRSRIGSAVGSRVESLPVQEVVLDELVVRVEAERLMVDIAPLCVRTDDDARNAQTIAIHVHGRRNDMVIKAAPVIPADKDRG